LTSRSNTGLLLTQKALRDLKEIEVYSVKQFSRKTADRYLDDLESGLQRIIEDPENLELIPEMHPSLRFYRVHKHLLACDVQANSIVVLTVIHASMDISERLAELQPLLSQEVEMLYRRLARRRRDS